jgi:hypothetical protein
VRPADWDRPLYYARRVRRLTLDGRFSDVDFPDSNTLDAISCSLGQEHLFPGLRVIRWAPDEDVFFPYIHMFLCTTITSATLVLPSASASNITVLPTLALRYPQLQHFSIESIWWSSILRRTSSIIALDLRQIQWLSLPALDRTALEHLSGLPCLRYLTLDSPEVADLDLPSSQGPPHPFPALRTLRLGSTTIDYAIEFVNLFPTSTLENLFVDTDVLTTKSTTCQFYTALATHLSHTTLQWLHIAEVDEMPSPPPGMIANYVITGPELSTLFCFGNLTDVSLRPPVGFDIDDATAWEMARAWPKLQSLVLDSASELSHRPGMSLLGLKAFANHCPALVTLHISFDASTVPPFDNSPESRISRKRLTSLDVASSSISDPPTVARFISGLFPELVEISTVREWRWEDDDREHENDEEVAARARHTLWKQVQAMVPVMTAIRREERNLAGVPVES